MRRTCSTCGRQIIMGREVDNAIRVVDAEPTGDADGVVLVGDLNDRPLAAWGVDPAGVELPWGIVIPAGAHRYRQHECPRGGA